MDDALTHRRLVGAGAAGAALLALRATPAPAAARRRTRRADVCIVGGGLAGLTAARALARAGKEVCVLEARDRVGGRTLNRSIGGGKIAEAGGEYVGPTQDRILALAKSVGVKFLTSNDGLDVQYFRGQRSTYPGGRSPVGSRGAAGGPGCDHEARSDVRDGPRGGALEGPARGRGGTR